GRRTHARRRPAPGSLPTRLQRWAAYAGTSGVGAVHESLQALRRPASQLLRRRLQSAGQLVLGAAAVAAQPAPPGLYAVDCVAARLGAPALALDGAARPRRAVRRLGVRRRGARPLRSADLRR